MNNLKKSILYALNSNHSLYYKNKIIHSAFKHAEKKKEKKVIIKKQINPKHKLIQELLNLGLKPKNVVNLKSNNINYNLNIINIDNRTFPLSKELKQKLISSNHNSYLILNNRGKKYSIRTIQEIRKFVLQ